MDKDPSPGTYGGRARIKLGKQAHLSGTAEFWIVLAMGKIESEQYVSGEESLEPLADKLKAAHYTFAFPVGSKAGESSAVLNSAALR